eukprot:scaffold27985_cov46-Phaeocystis_antarctica.AAC.3
MGGGPCASSDILGGDTLGGVLDGGGAGEEGREEDPPNLPNMRIPSFWSRASIVRIGDDRASVAEGTCFAAGAWSRASMVDCLRGIEGTCFAAWSSPLAHCLRTEKDMVRALGVGRAPPSTRTRPPSSHVAQPSGGDPASISSRSICVISSESHWCCLARGDAGPSVSNCDGPRLIAAGLGARAPPMPPPPSGSGGGTPVGV